MGEDDRSERPANDCGCCEQLRGELEKQRAEHASLRSEHAALRELAVREFADLTGQDGKNGKVGTLREKVTKLLDRFWWAFTVAVGSIGAAAVKLVLVSTAYGELKNQVRADQARLDRVESVLFIHQLSAPAVTPGKDSP